MQIEPRRSVRDSWIAGRTQEAGNDSVPCRVGKVDIEPPAGRVVWGERHPQQAPFAAGRDRRREIQEIRGDERAVLDDANAPALLDHELPRIVGGILDECDR